MKAVARGVAGGALLISLVTVLSRLFGFGRWAVFSGTVGSTAAGSAYTAANTLPNVLFEVAVGGALASVVVPLLALPLAERAMGQADQIASALVSWVLVVLVPLGGLLALAAGPLANALITADLEAQSSGTRALATVLIRMFALQVPLYGIGVVAGGVLHAARRFFWPALAPLLNSLTLIPVYLVFKTVAGGEQGQPGNLSQGAINLLGWGTTLGVAVLSLPLLVPLWRLGFRLRPQLRFPAGMARQAARLAMAGVVALLAQQVMVLVVVWLCGNYGTKGTLPVYNYAQALYLLPFAVLVVPLVTAFFPHLAGAAARGQLAMLSRGAAAAMRTVLAVAALGAAALLAAAPRLAAAFEVLDVGRVVGLSDCLSLMAPGLVGFGVMTLGQRLLYAVHQGRLAALVSGTAWLVAAAVSLLAVQTGSQQAAQAADGLATLRGLGLGLQVGMTVGGLGMVVAVGRVLGSAALRGLGRTAAAALVAGAVGAVLGRGATDQLPSGGLVAASLAACVGAVVAAGVVMVGLGMTDRSLPTAMRSWDQPTADDLALEVSEADNDAGHADPLDAG